MKTIHRRLTILIAAAALSLGAITTLLLVGARGPADPASSTSVQALYTIGQYEGQVAVFLAGSPGRIRYSTSMSPACPPRSRSGCTRESQYTTTRSCSDCWRITPAEDRRARLSRGMGLAVAGGSLASQPAEHLGEIQLILIPHGVGDAFNGQVAA